MQRKVTKEEAVNLIRRLQFLYSLLSKSSKEKLLESCNKNPLRRFLNLNIENLHEYIEKHSEPSERIYLVVDDYDRTVDTNSIDSAIHNIKFLIKKQLKKFSIN